MRIALLEDEDDLADLMVSGLAGRDYDVVRFSNGRALVAYLKRETVDLAILDWGVPGLSGAEVLSWIRLHLDHALPVLFVTSRSDEHDIVATLDAGADDYLVKPVRMAEANARIAALLRRSYPAPAGDVETFDDYSFSRADATVTVAGEPVALSRREFDLALFLFRNRDRALSRAYLMDRVWKQDTDIVSRTLDVHVSRLREKLKLHPRNGYKVATVYSYGYRLERATPAAGDMP